MTKGGVGVSQKVIFNDKGGGGGSRPRKKYDIIYEQSLVYNNFPTIVRLEVPN